MALKKLANKEALRIESQKGHQIHKIRNKDSNTYVRDDLHNLSRESIGWTGIPNAGDTVNSRNVQESYAIEQ